ncbi:phosphoethanolamine transferase [Xenorhabdus szentirmaii]|uniref:phosphoethanolamine transferase n=1 Tax=Xenorhabdus szentirmaii TaxID=290112 RepID=UPI000C03AC1C|nr:MULTISPECIES: phosphoethanolamine transferase [Xenorhabdus]MBD2781125.1 phosphoethanolamine transferase [Xenorhabdus sp. 38]PHM43094.1 hypothetical protein Xszus_02873 [Xenorhabdus szentirmaii]
MKGFNLIKPISKIYFLLFFLNSLYLISAFKKFNDNEVFLSLFLILLFLFFIGNKSSKLNKTTFLILSVLDIFAIIEFITKRLSGFYFHDVPNEIISIVYDTNISEIKSNIYFSSKEVNGFILLFLNLLFVFKLRCVKKKNDLLVSFFMVLFVFMFFVFSNNPINAAVKSIVNNRDVIKENINAIKNRKNFVWGAIPEEDEKQTMVLFLGETHRGDYLSINGYSKQTTPLLEKENIISFKNAISQAAYTLQSTPMILSRKDVNDKGIFREKSLISAFKEAGFETWYVSYLPPALYGDNEINLIANEADHYVKSNVNNKTLKEILSNNSHKKLIVYKTIGSHYLYHERYPNEYNIFKPSFKNDTYNTPSFSDKEKLENDYANSIVFSVDKQVSDFIKILKKESGLVSLSFISDHGTSIYDDGESLYGGNTKGNYNIALFFWFNDVYNRLYPNDIETLINNRNKKVSGKYFLDTMLDIGKVSSKVRKGFSLLETDLKEKNRYIKNRNIYDYDRDIKN